MATALKEDAGTQKIVSHVNACSCKSNNIVQWLVSKLFMLSILYTFFFQWQGHLDYSTTGPMSNMHCGNTGVLKPNKVIDAEGCTIGSCIMLLSWSCIMYSVSGCIAVPYSPVLKSTGGSPQITMRFINQGSEELSLYWVKYSGGTRSYGKVQAGGPWVVTTYGTHPNTIQAIRLLKFLFHILLLKIPIS